jgi:hypothetical protein
MPYLRKTADPNDPQTPSALMSGYGSTPSSSQPMSASPSVNAPREAGSKQQNQPGSPDTGSSATGYVNFDRFFNANKDAAQNTANRVSSQVGGDAKKAQTDLTDLQNQFAQQSKAGEVQGPSSDQSSWAQNGSRPTNITSTPQPQTQQGEGLESEPTKSGTAPTAGPPPKQSNRRAPITGLPVGPQADNFYAQRDATMQGGIDAGAQGQYTGPTALDVLSGYGQAEADKSKANDELAATQSAGGLQGLLQSEGQPGGYSDSMSAFDAGLTSRAGGQQFGGLRSKYGGLDAQYAKALGDSQTDAAAAKARSDANAQQYQSLKDQYGARQKAASDAAANPADPPDPLAKWDGFDPAVQGYGDNLAGQYDPGYNYNQEGGGYSQSAPWQRQYINVGVANPGATGPASGGAGWDNWFGGGDPDNTSPEDLGLTPSEIWSLSLMTPEQRAAWLKKHGKKS